MTPGRAEAIGRPIAVIMGTRPEIIKLAPVINLLKTSVETDPILIGTGQHSTLYAQTAAEFGLSLDHSLRAERSVGDLGEFSGGLIAQLSALFRDLKPSAVLVQGDTNSTVAAALAAFYSEIPVFHLEAGLRSGDMSSPFPEEANRRIIALLATHHLAPTRLAVENLEREKISPSAITLTGNTVVDALRAHFNTATSFTDPVIQDLFDAGQKVLVFSMHRRESWGIVMERVCSAVAQFASERTDVSVVAPLHPNPAVTRSARALFGVENIHATHPLPYGEFLRLLSMASGVLTDSGGIQEEAPSFRVPVLVLRNRTERVEGVSAGLATAMHHDWVNLPRQIARLVDDGARTPSGALAHENPYGDGQAARRAFDAILRTLRRHEYAGSV
jgi:UDP-N-acetylglucosamine 2-epimerase (non-hydrolysing)